MEDRGCISSARGVLLYYKYVSLGQADQPEVARFYETTCGALGLRGRVRVAEDGVNVVLAGSLSALEEHMQTIREHSLLQGTDIDFKLAPDLPAGVDARATEETGFDHLTVRQCKELVTLGALAQGRADPHKHTAPHVTPATFHQLLEQAAQLQGNAGSGMGDGTEANGEDKVGDPGSSAKEVVLLDARNMYETAIGHFHAAGVPLLDPHTRCFSDLPAWIDRHAPLLANKRVMMYCTGGVRCERASAYLREKGPEFQDVVQLQGAEEDEEGRQAVCGSSGFALPPHPRLPLASRTLLPAGGIQRYLEAFPDGGFFRGKLMVYDHRVAVPAPAALQDQSPRTPAHTARPEQLGEAATGAGPAPQGPGGASTAVPPVQSHLRPAGSVVGQCIVCAQPWDDYHARLRCRYCRQLILVCDACVPHHGAAAAPAPAAPSATSTASSPAAAFHQSSPESRPSGPRAEQGLLCLLCQERGVTPEGVSVQPPAIERGGGRQRQQRQKPGDSLAAGSGPGQGPGREARAQGEVAAGAAPEGASTQAARRLRILCLHGFRQTASSFEGRTHALRKKLRDLADFIFIDAPHTLPFFIKPGHGAPCEHAGEERQQDQEPAQAGAAALQGQGDPQQDASQQAQGQRNEGQRQTHTGLPPVPPERARKRAWLLSPVLMELQRQRQQQQQRQPVETSESGHTPSPGNGTADRWTQAPPGSALSGPSPYTPQGPEAVQTAGRLLQPDEPGGCGWQVAPPWVSAAQHLQQTEGEAAAEQVLEAALQELGPFDGVLGFSQGAALAAVLCARQQRRQQQLGQQQEESAERGQGAAGAQMAIGPDYQERQPDQAVPLRFAILASGFPSPCPAHQRLMAEVGTLALPSLHLFGGEHGGDAQIGTPESESLLHCFSAPISIRHGSAHIIPASRPYVSALRDFLQQFL